VDYSKADSEDKILWQDNLFTDEAQAQQ
jgi:hypothetical protein